MKNRLLIWILALFLAASAACAAPPNPEYYWGYVYIEEELAPDGANLTCWSASGDLLVNDTLPYNDTGSYFAQIEFDKPHTPADEGADINESITWYVDGIAALSPANDTAETGKNNNNLTITGIRNPNVTVSLNYSSLFSIQDSFDLTVVLNNTGDGSANSDVVYDGEARVLYTAKNNTNSTIFDEALNVCGDFNNSLDINIRNFANTSVSEHSYDILYTVAGPDLDVNLSVSDTNPMAGDIVTLSAAIANAGEENVSGYNFSLYAGASLLISTEYNETLEPGSARNITYFWTAAAGVSQILAAVNSSTVQCLLTNDEETVNISVSSSSTGGGGGGSSRIIAEQNRTEPETFEIMNFPKTLGNLIFKDRIRFKVDNEWYTIIIEDVSDGRAATTMTWENMYYVFEEGDEKVFEIKNYDLYVELEEADGGKAKFRLDLIEKPLFEVSFEMPDSFVINSDVTFTLEIDSDLDVIIEEILFKSNRQIWNRTTAADSGRQEESLGELEQGEYYLYIKLMSGSRAKEFEKEFLVGDMQLPVVQPSAFDLQDLLILMLIILVSAAIILGVRYFTEQENMKRIEEEEEESRKPEGGKEESKMQDIQEIQEDAPEPGIIDRIKNSILSVFAGKEKKEEQGESESLTKDKIIKEEPRKEEIRHMDFVGRKGNVYLPYENLIQLREWLREYHASQHITLKMRRMPEIVQKLGPDVYENPREATRDDFVRLNILFNEKHDYISYNDLVIGGSIITRELKKLLGVKEPEQKPAKKEFLIRYIILNKIEDAQRVLDSLRRGEIVIANAQPIYRSSRENLKRAVDKIRNTCDALGGDIGLTFNTHLIVTPRKNITIYREHKE
jgi:SepF-like predicted cell division protein (DUF552 family)